MSVVIRVTGDAGWGPAGATVTPMTTLTQRRTRAFADLGIATSDGFAFTGVARTRDHIQLHYHLDGVGDLTEDLTFQGVDLAPTNPTVEDALARATRLVHLLAGVSYLKATLPARIDTGPLSPTTARLLRAVLVDGLAELAWHHDVDLHGYFDLDGPAPSATAPTDVPHIAPTNGPLVPVGGGKDSIVTLTAMADHEPTLFAVNPKGPILRTFARADMPTVTVERRLDPALFDLNERGAINGHVPITAIVSAIAVVAAIAGGHDAVVLSNEASADEPTLVTDDGVAVNHQWSKSSVFEALFSDVVTHEVVADVDYFSLLRGASELWIARRFAELGDWDATFNSCNRAFSLRGQRRDWCGQCPKCRFVFLALAPFTGRERITSILGANLLDDQDQVEDFAALVGLTDHKPFECVGEADESAAALARLAADPAWADDAVVAALGPGLALGPDAIEGFLDPPDVSGLPARFRDALS